MTTGDVAGIQQIELFLNYRVKAFLELKILFLVLKLWIETDHHYLQSLYYNTKLAVQNLCFVSIFVCFLRWGLLYSSWPPASYIEED